MLTAQSRRLSLLLLSTLLPLAPTGCSQPPEPVSNATHHSSQPPPFSEIAKQSGLDFVHFNGMTGQLYYLETVGAGVALFDYDNDGDLDIYLVQGQLLGDFPLSSAIFPSQGTPPLSDRLYRNEWVESSRLQFTDVTEQAGISMYEYGMGVSAGDYDNDGWIDLYITNFGPNQLLHNRGDGTFEDVSASSDKGIMDSSWGSSAAFVDYDADGLLDLFVCNYVDFTLGTQKRCATAAGRHTYCGPKSYQPLVDRLLHNQGDGTFTDVTAVAGLHAKGACLGVVATDFNGDQRLDLYVANDGMQNFLWIQGEDGRFVNEALMGGVALNRDGNPEASMGVDAADFDNDGDEDLIVAHLKGETNTLYQNDGSGFFEDITSNANLGAASRSSTAFGSVWIDYDNDGWLDLFMANGEVNLIEEQVRNGDSYPLKQPNQLFHNLGNGRFEEVSQSAGKPFELLEVSRGAAFGDLDNDGDLDLVVTNNAGPVRLLRNDVGNSHHWLGLELLDSPHNRHSHSARVELLRESEKPLWRRVRTVASYLSSNDPRVLIGLGEYQGPMAVKVYWPDGAVEQWSGLTSDHYHQLRRGEGETPKPH